jgi:hypothetical protein
MLVENLSVGGVGRWLLLLFEVFICLAILAQLLIDKLRIGAMLDFVLLNESVNKVIEVVVEASNFVLHVFLEGHASHLNLVDETPENCRSIILLITKEN